MGSVYGNLLKISIFGESHGTGIGVVIDGFPAGVLVDEAFILSEMKRRAPGARVGSTPRKEPDIPRVLSGVKNNYTTGAPICAVIENTNTKSEDYAPFAEMPRPGHADFTASIRYHGYQDARGGGHFSGRLTAPLTFAGALCKLVLKQKGIEICGHILQIGDLHDDAFALNPTTKEMSDLQNKQFPVINETVSAQMQDLLEETRKKLDSVGGTIECIATGIPAGVGSPMFDTVESRISSLLFAIPAVRGVSFGAGFEAASMFGSKANDAFYYENEVVKTTTNHHGGALGGITTGMPILLRCALKPTPSIAQRQSTVNLTTGENTEIEIQGRHDACIVCRAVPVVEAAVAISLLDQLLEAYGYGNFR